MHSDIHLRLHALRAADLRTEAARYRLSRATVPAPGALRGRLGWFLVETGLRLVRHRPAHVARIA
ncbi:MULTISPECIES: hypothetical protein [Streptomyces]|uniref:hypothetical protein n=1 Tax=Streptomyces TaxID=1883 RepID=UPI00084C4805|nr:MULTISPECIES: hypothetical protein [Streptomyces]TFI29960.1 hypothetical protein E4P36_04155 [Streptomyces sp. 4R-3d]